MNFCIAYFMIAEKYRQISINVPARMQGQEVPDPTQCYQITYWTLFLMNILVPIFSFFASTDYELKKLHGGEPTLSEIVLRDIGWDLTGVL